MSDPEQDVSVPDILDREFFEAFAHEMQENSSRKGDWRALVDDDEMDWAWLLEELQEHVDKLRRAVQNGHANLTAEHCADVAGNAMMLWRYGRRQAQEIAEWRRERASAKKAHLPPS